MISENRMEGSVEEVLNFAEKHENWSFQQDVKAFLLEQSIKGYRFWFRLERIGDIYQLSFEIHDEDHVRLFGKSFTLGAGSDEVARALGLAKKVNKRTQEARRMREVKELIEYERIMEELQ